MSLAQFQKAYDEIHPSKINVSGLGEPFLNPQIFDIIKYAKSNGSAVNCATNFTAVQNKIDKIIDSGIDQLKISIDAATAATFLKIRKLDLHHTLLNNINKLNKMKEELQSPKPEIRFNFALQRDNIDELVDTVELAHSLGVKAMYIQFLSYVDREDRKSFLVGDMSPAKVKQVLQTADLLTQKYGIATNINMWMQEFDVFINNMQPLSQFQANNRPCYFPWLSTWVDATGDVRPCPVIPWQKGTGVMGNIFQDKFSTIWNNDKYRSLRQALRRGERPTDVCKSCVPVSLSTIFQIGTKLLPSK
jgi:radical SAM protein with 4Fe4S-binding SPASM domain